MGITFRLVLTGKLLPGATFDSAAAALARLLRLDHARAESLLASAPTVIKKTLPHSELETYLKILQKTGAEVLAEASNASVPAAILPPAADTSAAILELIEPASTITCPKCHREQIRRNLCIECGTDMPRALAVQAEPIIARARPLPIVIKEPEFDTPSFWGVSTAGRLGRVRYLTSSLLVLCPLLILAIFAPFMGSKTMSGGLLVPLFGLMAWTLWQSFRLMILRLHDLNKPASWIGWFLLGAALVGMMPKALGLNGVNVLGSLCMIIASCALSFVPGDHDENDFGFPAEPPALWHLALALVVLLISLFSLPSLFVRGKSVPLYQGQALSEADIQARYQQQRKILSEHDLDLIVKNESMENNGAAVNREEVRKRVQQSLDEQAMKEARTPPEDTAGFIPNRRKLSESELDELVRNISRENGTAANREEVRREAQRMMDQQARKKAGMVSG
ncbi:DUF805 domain-containing protein [Iodobacter sp. LRB]|uniref:DUF805 domain-containing protein n=1 Tax=unclassified Iodobacter TaxID=235634 RepID=UPI000C0E9B0E|nr:DUF805 domain-containing protein [Iodobacter sp. BJB302]PHV00860.1 hypothetical protein CSQ88_15010 [Iodobacter sp. BJB302]